MERIQMAIKRLQKDLSELRYDLHLKECQTPNIYDSIECEILWKRSQTDDAHLLIFDNINEDKSIHNYNSDFDDMPEYSTTATSPSSISSPTSYEHCLFSVFTENNTLKSRTNKDDDKLTSIDTKNILIHKKQCKNENKSISNREGITMMFSNSNTKKRRFCINCGKC